MLLTLYTDLRTGIYSQSKARHDCVQTYFIFEVLSDQYVVRMLTSKRSYVYCSDEVQAVDVCSCYKILIS